MISAAVPIAMPMALIADIRLITLCDFFAKRYLRAMKSGKCKELFFQKFINMLGIVEGSVKEKCDFRYNP